MIKLTHTTGKDVRQEIDRTFLIEKLTHTTGKDGKARPVNYREELESTLEFPESDIRVGADAGIDYPIWIVRHLRRRRWPHPP